MALDYGSMEYCLSINGMRQAVNATGALSLIAGRRYDIVLEYNEQSTNASVRLEWSSPSQAREVIPASRLFPAERGLLSQEVWNGIAGANVSNLTSSPAFPNNPSTVNTVAAFVAAPMSAVIWATLAGYLHVPVTGEYSFYIAGDQSASFG